MSQEPTTHPTYSIANVVVSVLVFYALVGVFGARSLYNWSAKLPVSKTAKTLQTLTEAHWARTAGWGLEGPEIFLERHFMELNDTHRLLYPKTYKEFVQNRDRKAKVRKLAKVDKEILEEEAKAGLDQAKGPKVLVMGDSIMITVGPVIKKDIVAKLSGAAVVKAKLATGLARPDVFDWVKELQRSTVIRHYDYVVMMLGTNDSQDFTEDGEIQPYGTTEWVKTYNKRLAALMDAACEGATHGIWIGLPPMKKAAFNLKAVRINSWAQRQVKKHACMQYVGLDDVLGDEDGRFTTYLSIGDHQEKVRMVDGIHVNAAGGSLVSEALMGMMADGTAAAQTLISH